MELKVLFAAMFQEQGCGGRGQVGSVEAQRRTMRDHGVSDILILKHKIYMCWLLLVMISELI